MEWFNEPPQWAVQDDRITVTSAPQTDFWRTTRYGFVRDSGHFYSLAVTGDFTAEVRIHGAYQALYDQAGLMIRADATTWMKCGVEFVDGVQQASTVVTRDVSDWSVVPLPDNPLALRMRVVRQGAAVEVQYARDGDPFTLLRLAYLTPLETVQVGLMCASPEGDGFTTVFEQFTVFGAH
jgi:regulation of enolase protein 1 (concanavalin A-like superfamily)